MDNEKVVVDPIVSASEHTPPINNHQASTLERWWDKTSGGFHEIYLRLRPLLRRRTRETCRAMHPQERWWHNLRAFCRGRGEGANDVEQYRIPPRKERSLIPLGIIRRGFNDFAFKCVVWTFRASYLGSMLSFLVFFFALIFLYAVIIRAAVIAAYNRNREECIPGWDFITEGKHNENFSLAFELSWTTLSTVGFGVVSVPADSNCRVMRYILATEAFLGVLYIGLCSALFFSKISRDLTKAHVTFSSAICLQYERDSTPGARSVGRSTDETEEKGSREGSELTSFPFLQFRVINDKGNYRGGEITDAELKGVVMSVRVLDKKPLNKMFSTAFGLDAVDDKGNALQHEEKGIDALTGAPTVQRMYRGMQLEPSRHPHFSNGPWYVRHLLDQKSPFLKNSVRRQIDQLAGWPAAWNSPEEIRERLDPTIYEVGMIFTGISGHTVSGVFKTQIWKPEDIYIGWKFVSISYLSRKPMCKEDDGKEHWKIDLSLIHDICPQDHGGNEALLGIREPQNVVRILRRQIDHQSSKEDNDVVIEALQDQQ